MKALRRVSALLLILAGLTLAREPRVMEVLAADGSVRWSAPVVSGERIDLWYVHSSERCTWTHHFTAGPGAALTQLSSTFPCYGAGMPAGSTVAVRGAEGFRVPARRRLAEGLTMMNWRASDITLRYRGLALPVGEWFADYEAFSVRIR